LSEPALAFVPSRRGHFRTESGYHTDLWMDLETLCRRPAVIDPLARELATRLRPYHVDAVCGPLNEGAFVALMVAAHLGCEFTYAERFADADRAGLFPVRYALPPPLRALVRGRRVAIVNDVISAGSAVRGTWSDLESLGAQVVAIGALLVLGDTFARVAEARSRPLEALERAAYPLWTPDECPLCRAGVPLTSGP
jgi:orotate phosphoribosyltransferase